MEEFREACGPADPEVAKALYPDSLRALLGVQQVRWYWLHAVVATYAGILCRCHHLAALPAVPRTLLARSTPCLWSCWPKVCVDIHPSVRLSLNTGNERCALHRPARRWPA